MTARMRTLFLCVTLCLCMAAGLGAEEFFTANDLEAAQLTAVKSFGNFTIFARSDKNVTIEAMAAPRIAADGEVFNNRIKLNGGGAVDYRSIRFKTAAAGEVLIYTNSSSKTDARTLVLAKVSDGVIVAELVAPPDDEKNAGIAKASLAGAGEYVLYSKNSGINIYQILLK